MLRDAQQTAQLIALLFIRSKHNRARIGQGTVRMLSHRKRLRRVFLKDVIDELDSLGVMLIENDRGGFGLILSSSLDGAPSITAKKFIMDDLVRLKNKKMSFDDLAQEIEEHLGLSEDSED